MWLNIIPLIEMIVSGVIFVLKYTAPVISPAIWREAFLKRIW